MRFQNVGTATVTVSSADGGSASATLTVTPGAVLTPLAVAPTIVQAANIGERTATVGFINNGSQPLSVSLASPSFDLSPASLSLGPGATQAVSFTGKALPAGTYTYDLTLPQKRCCPLASQTYTVTLVSLVPSGSAGDVAPDTDHFDIIAPPDAAFAPAIVTFANSGSAPVSGTVTSDVHRATGGRGIRLQRQQSRRNLRVLGFVVPQGSVSADLSHAGGSGTFVGYATRICSTRRGSPAAIRRSWSSCCCRRLSRSRSCSAAALLSRRERTGPRSRAENSCSSSIARSATALAETDVEREAPGSTRALPISRILSGRSCIQPSA